MTVIRFTKQELSVLATILALYNANGGLRFKKDAKKLLAKILNEVLK